MLNAVKFEVLLIVGNSEKPKECSEWKNSLKIKVPVQDEIRKIYSQSIEGKFAKT